MKLIIKEWNKTIDVTNLNEKDFIKENLRSLFQKNLGMRMYKIL